VIGRAAIAAALPLALLASCQTVSSTPEIAVDSEQWLAAKAEIYRDLALRSLRSGDLERARQLLSEAVQFEEDDVRSLQLLGRLCLASGDLVEAKTYSRWWLRLEPDSVSALCLNGIIDESLGNFAEAEGFFHRACDLDPDDPRPLVNLHTFLLNRGREAQAASVRKLTRERFPDCHEVLLDHASYLESRGQWTSALEVFQEARELRPQDLELAVRAGTAALLGDREEVLVELERELPPRARLEDASLALLLATQRLRSGDEEAVLQELDLLGGAAREDPVVCLLRGEILLGRQDLAGAEAAFRDALRHDDQMARAHAGLARVQLARGQQHAATRTLQRAVDLEPRNAVSRALLAACLASVGDLERASEHLDVARYSGKAALLIQEIEQRFPALVAADSQEEGS
jgi:Flp pilus assembly protein TadD